MKTVDFSETIEACDLKVGRYRQLIDHWSSGFIAVVLLLLQIF